jgi:ketosteroid isomerase-like protein
MRIGALATAATLFVAFAAWAGEPNIPIADGPPVRVHGPVAVAKQLIAAEQAFEVESVAKGPAVAMRDNFDAQDGLIFAGGEPARGAAAIYATHGGDKPGGKLTWVPAEVFADRGGDMGATWGHFRFVPPGATGPAVTGKYVTVWRKNAAGQWKGLIDIGNPD